MTTTSTLRELTGDYVLDPAGTRIGFVARALLVSRVRGAFGAFEGGGRLDGADPSRSAVRLAIRAGSVGTGNDKRDDHLRGGDFLDADVHPSLTFTSTRVERAGATGFRVTGDLTVRGVTRPVTVDVELTGAGNDPRGAFRVGFTGRAVIDRDDWGVGGGRGMVGRKVALELDIAAIRQS
ncbi:YceI family protein [Streptomyces olindensis]|uniref:YceI family protein n=1 Tax=Streptomyces olindensis TaxID=358823 RepID=UPI0036B32E92